MKLRFTPRAVDDVNAISSYLRERNAGSARKVRASIYATLQNVLLFPLIGAQQDVADVRKVVTRRYRYLIYYTVDELRDELIVLNTKHHAETRAYDDL